MYSDRDSLEGSRGFSLIELLLVIALLALLAAMLFPLFHKTKKMSNRAKCANNLRQLATAFTLYADDWDGYWPCPGGLVGNRSYWSQTGDGGLNAYIKQSGLESVWCCPLLKQWNGKYPPRSYSMNSYLREPPDVEFPTCIGILSGICVQKIRVPSKTILLYEGIPFSEGFDDLAYREDKIYYIYRCANWSWVRGYWDGYLHTQDPGQCWHGSRNNYLHTDGHIVCRTPGKKTNGTLSTREEMYLWYADKSNFHKRFGPAR